MSSDKEISVLLKALSNPIRVSMLRELMTCKNCINGELVRKFPVSQATVSQYLEVLAKAKLIKIKKQGTTSQYCINGQKSLLTS
jgi:DNA-binding transcriptional ArsR family regulator